MSQQTPYLGLRPYQYSDRGNFFGRDADCEILIDKLLSNRLTLLFAASGVGKSSLLNAAVLPQLKDPLGENLSVVYHNDWVQNPLSALQSSIREAVSAAKQAPAEQTLSELLKFCSLFIRHPFVIVLDQCEEFFRYQRGKADFDEFIQQLTAVILDTELPVSLVISMREDFALELNAFKPRLPTLLFENYYRLEKMKPEAARDAIVQPLRPYGFQYEPALLSRLINDLSSQQQQQQLLDLTENHSEPYVEPAHLQIVCNYLWQKNKNNDDKTLSLSSYEKAGGAKGIVQYFLADAQQGFSTTEKNLASKAFDYLAAQGGVKMAYPANVLASILKVDSEKLTGVLDKLASDDVRILRKQTRDTVPWYELYHDMFSPSIERWNNEWKAKRLRKQRWISGGLGAILLAGTALLVDSFMWIQKNNFPADALFTEQRFRLMHWGLLKPPIPEMVEIAMPESAIKMGEYNTEWHSSLSAEFSMNFGSPLVDISIQKPFSIGKYEITYEQFDYFVWQSLKSGVTDVAGEKLEYPTGSTRENGRGKRAASQVSWHEADAYTKWLSERSETSDYRLPTEAEWEYAARAGSSAKTTYWWGDTASVDGQAMANCIDCEGNEEYKRKIAPVGSYKPNGYGLYDTAGNVWEWTCSAFANTFEGEEQKCAENSSSRRVIRGGSWLLSTPWLRSSSRFGLLPVNRDNDVGFRIISSSRTN